MVDAVLSRRRSPRAGEARDVQGVDMSELTTLRELYRAAAANMRTEWARDLPLDELVSDRWERAGRLGFGAGASIYASSYVYGDVIVGARTWVGPFTILDGSGGLSIGENCSIS